MPADSYRFYSPFISGAQRLVNGNTLITEGSGGRVIEVTPQHEIVWEFISPYWGAHMKMNMVYRAYRVPYDWIPQVSKPEEIAIQPIEVKTYRVPGASNCRSKQTEVEGVMPYQGTTALCIADDEEAK